MPVSRHVYSRTAWSTGVGLLATAFFLTSRIASAQDDAPTGGEGAVPRGPGTAVVRPSAGQPEQKIVMPRQTKFVEATYPPDAQKAGIQAEVILYLNIDKTGKVTRAEVAAPAGHGFDEAAVQAALGFEFEPATRDGTPIAVRIPYKYTFTLKEVEAPPEAQKAPTVGNLGGTIHVASVDAAIAGAVITVTKPDGATVTVTADAQGKWVLEGVPPGKYHVHVTAAGFVAIDVDEEVTVGEATDVIYRLAVVPVGIEVTVSGERPPREVTKRTIERREMERIPGTSGDALRSIQSLPGVARPPGFAGLLIVRGSAPQDTQVFVDGAAVPLIYHFGGLSSTIPTELLDKIDFYPGNFSARYGQVMGGVVDVALRQPDTQCTGDYGKPIEKYGCFHAMVQADLIDTRAVVQGPLGGNWTFAAAGRRSWVDAWLKPVLKSAGTSVTTAPVYYDYQLIVDDKPTPKSHFSARFFGSDDRLQVLLQDPSANEPAFAGNLTFGTSFYTAQALYTNELSKSVDLYAMAAVGKTGFDFALGPVAFKANANPISLRSELSFKIIRGFVLHAGLDFLTAPYHFIVRAPAAPAPGEPDPGPLSTRPILETDASSTAFRPAWYAEGEVRPSRRALIVPGVRLDYARDTGHTDLSPRINGRYDFVGGTAEEDRPFDERRLRTTVKGGVGIFAQPPQFQETNAVFGTPGLLSNRSIHYSVGMEQEFTHQIEMSVEGYFKDLTHLVARSESLGPLYVYDNAGTGYVVGMELLLKYKPDKRFFGWLAYTLSRSIRRDHPDEPEYLFQYDQTHNLTVLGSYRLGRGWEVGARFRLISGSLATPVIKAPGLPALYAADAGAYTPIQGQPFSSRLPLFHQLDIRIDKAWQMKDWRFSAYLDVQNAYNNPAAEGLAYNYNYTKSSYQTGLPIIPSIGFRGEL
jgi:TonB family protein